MIAWPLTLPQYGLVSGYSRTMADPRIMTETDSGSARARRRLSYMPEIVQITYFMSREELAALKAFVAGPLGGGVFPYTIPNQDNPDITVPWVVQIGQTMPSWTRADLDWYVRMELVRYP